MDNPRLEKLLKFYDNDPKDAFIIFALAKEYEQLENEEKALELYEQIRIDQPDYIGVYYHLAKLQEKRGDFAIALDIYEEGIKKATAQNDFHALSELKNAKLNLELEEGL